MDTNDKESSVRIGWVAWTPVGYIVDDFGAVSNELSNARVWKKEEFADAHTRMFPNGTAKRVEDDGTGWKLCETKPN